MTSTKDNNKKRFIKIWLVFSGLAAAFYLFVYPFLIASKILEPIFAAIAFGVFLYLQLLLLTAEFVFMTFASLYNFKNNTLLPFMNPERFHGAVSKEKRERQLSKKSVFITIILSYFFVIYSFAITYLFIGNFTSNSFDKPQVTFIDSIFLSFTSISVGPSGLQPNSILTKILVMTEILIGLIYAALVFSLIASLMLKDRAINEENTNKLENKLTDDVNG
jgi:hypothetical protein